MTRIITAKNVNHALVDGIWWLRIVGQREQSRNGEVLVAPSPVITEYGMPEQRVLFLPERDANPIFHMVESFWMLAGKNDVSPLLNFNKRMLEYAEPDGRIHGAYGFRWLNQWHDQLLIIIDLLKNDRDSRQAVLQMWHAELDLGAVKKDLPCLAGDTVLRSPEGNLPIAEVAAKFDSGEVGQWPVYSYNTETGQYKLSWCTKVWKSGRKKTVKLTFMDGSSIRCTPDHTLYRRHGSNPGVIFPISAGKVKPGARMHSHPFWASREWEVLSDGVGAGTYEPVHELYADLLGWDRTGMVLHHKDDNPRNNKRDNLELMTRSDHARRHAQPVANWLKKKRVFAETEQRGFNGRSHIVTAVEEWEEEDVYDFTVPGDHTALIGTGLVAHNCNTHVYFDCREGRLNMTVCCRSNDMLWGAYGANAVHFSVLQEVVASGVGLPIGVYRQFSNNFHVYPDTDVFKKLWNSPPLAPYDPYEEGCRTIPLVGEGEDWLDFMWDCERLFGRGSPTFRTYFMTEVGYPLIQEYLNRKSLFKYNVEGIPDCDWKRAFVEWAQRRDNERE